MSQLKSDKMGIAIYSGKIAISFRVFQYKRHRCILKTDLRQGPEVIMT